MIGDTVGDPLKDTSGPSLNILIKLMAVESLVLAPFFLAHTKVRGTAAWCCKDLRVSRVYEGVAGFVLLL